MNAFETTGIVFRYTLISAVFRLGGGSQVANPIVGSVAVYVVYDPVRPFSVREQPSQSVRHIVSTIDADFYISAFVDRPGQFPGLMSIASRDKPMESSSSLVVSEQARRFLEGDSAHHTVSLAGFVFNKATRLLMSVLRSTTGRKRQHPHGASP